MTHTPETIMAHVSAQTGVPVELITGETRLAKVAWARHAAMYLCFELTPMSPYHIARAFNRSSGSTVSHAVRRVRNESSVYPHRREAMEDLITELKGLNHDD